MKRMYRCYVAGRLSDPTVHYIRNLARMISLGNDARRAGFAVFVPGNDIIQGLVDGDFDYNDYFWNSQPWLMVSDAVLVVEEGWRTSHGVNRELETAKKHGIPVFFKLSDMVKHFEEVK